MNKSEYNIEILPLAYNDLMEIVRYISHKLYNPTSAKKLVYKFEKSFYDISIFPYGMSSYSSKSDFKCEYRNYKVDSYLVFYLIDELGKKIIISRIINERMNIVDLLNNDI